MIWLVFQISDIVTPALGLPDWVHTLIVLLGILGFPIAAALAWIFDLTPEGIVLDVRKSSASFSAGSRKPVDLAVDALLIAAAITICVLLFNASFHDHPDPVLGASVSSISLEPSRPHELAAVKHGTGRSGALIHEWSLK